NFYPPSSDARSDFWVSSTSGGALMANSLLWAGKVPPIILTGPTNLIKSPGGAAAFNVTATGLPPLTYQWSKSGAVIPGATTSSLSFSSQTSSNGLYTVMVSNVYGVAISQAGTLNSPVHFLPVSLSSSGAFPLLLGAADGTPLTAYRASRISIYSTTNVSAPFATWTPVAAPLFLSNGLVWVEGLSVTNSHTFFRAAEAP
ncbi:MAG TPA: immunoglobulin domain-containing protein, partial [Verrucomicrobiae bacterium]|nr:immunoglobulin domain-containing protein [Verrucomicrobiae bacterium]